MAYTEKPVPDIAGREPLFREVDSWYRPIGLIGYAGTGKDWLASRLIEQDPFFTRVSFIDELWELALQIDPLVGEDPAWRLAAYVEAYGREAAKQIPEVRRFLQELGKGVRDRLDEDAWVKATNVLGRARRCPVVLVNVRYPNEAALVERLDGILVRVLRPGVGPVNDHVSETGLDGWPVQITVWNSGVAVTTDPIPVGALHPEEALPLLRDLGRQKTHGRIR